LLYDSTGTVTLPQTQIDITGLSIGKNDELRLVYTFVGDTDTTTRNYDLRVNDITSNYTNQLLAGDGSTIFASRDSNARLAGARSNRKTTGFADIKVSNNDRFIFQTQMTFNMGAGSSAVENQNSNIINTGTVTSITKLSVVASATNGIAAGSRIRLYKVNTGDA
jgi:hypothetical protein